VISRLRIIGAEDQNWHEFGPGEVGIGWDSMVLGLAIHLATGESIDPFVRQGTATAAGRRFLTRAARPRTQRMSPQRGPDGGTRIDDPCIRAYLGEE
jgi:hypothetical protein